MTTDLLLSPDDVAEILGLSTSTLAKWRQIGEPSLPFLRLNGRIKYRASDLDDFLDNASNEEVDEEEEEENDEDDTDDDEDNEDS